MGIRKGEEKNLRGKRITMAKRRKRRRIESGETSQREESKEKTVRRDGG